MAIIERLIMMFTRTEATIITAHDARINQINFSMSGGKMSQLKIPFAMARMPPMVMKASRSTASEAVHCSIRRLSIKTYIIARHCKSFTKSAAYSSERFRLKYINYGNDYFCCIWLSGVSWARKSLAFCSSNACITAFASLPVR